MLSRNSPRDHVSTFTFAKAHCICTQFQLLTSTHGDAQFQGYIITLNGEVIDGGSVLHRQKCSSFPFDLYVRCDTEYLYSTTPCLKPQESVPAINSITPHTSRNRPVSYPDHLHLQFRQVKQSHPNSAFRKQIKSLPTPVRSARTLTQRRAAPLDGRLKLN